MSLPRVLIVDDHPIVADGLLQVLAKRFDVVGAVNDGRVAVDAVARIRPDAVLLDLVMPHVSGFEVLRGLAERRVETRAIVLTMLDDAQLAVDALTEGASGFLIKTSSSDELLTALDVVLNGGTYIASTLRKDIVTHMLSGPARPRVELTLRQREVLRLVLRGQRAKEIAGALDLSPRTVEAIKYRLMQILQVHTTAELVRCAVEHGLVPL